MYKLHRETVVKTTLEKAWAFIQNPANLNLITPDDMSFEIRSELPERMFEGMLVEYRVKIPVLGIRPWLSELKHIVPGRSFVDEQRIGPYALWYHYHGLEETDEGIKFIDEVTYEVPFGLIGRIAHALFIRKTLDRIFDFREACFARIFEQSR
jgi:ligand-binding SRPBCC domain-containing protein